RFLVEVVKDPFNSEKTFNEFEYKDEALEEAEEFYTKEISDDELFQNPWKNWQSPANYIADIEEQLTQETNPKDKSLEQELQKSVDTIQLSTKKQK
ncbi:46210_t:CDS:1, partial [Gigaspora margarita]